MRKLIRRTELVANVAIICMAVVLSVVLVRNYLFPAPKPMSPPMPASITPGTKIALPGVDWKANGKTLVLALSTSCRFCTESAPFYQRVVEQRAKNQNVRLVAVFPEPVAKGQKYLTDLGITVDEVIEARLDAFGVVATPTLIMTDSAGAVADSWRGKLPSEKESEVLGRLN
jgi:hypothetical protein